MKSNRENEEGISEDRDMHPQSNQHNRYKTSMCRHFEQMGTCHLGERCHFAHGFQELRTQNLPPRNEPGEQENKSHLFYGGKNGTYSNYKTIKCKYYEKDGTCKYGASCSFAHGGVDLRNPTDPLPGEQGYQSHHTHRYMGHHMHPRSHPRDMPMGRVYSHGGQEMEPRIHAHMDPLHHHHSSSHIQKDNAFFNEFRPPSSHITRPPPAAEHVQTVPPPFPIPVCPPFIPFIANVNDYRVMMGIQHASHFIQNGDKINAKRVLDQMLTDGVIKFGYPPNPVIPPPFAQPNPGVGMNNMNNMNNMNMGMGMGMDMDMGMRMAMGGGGEQIHCFHPDMQASQQEFETEEKFEEEGNFVPLAEEEEEVNAEQAFEEKEENFEKEMGGKPVESASQNVQCQIEQVGNGVEENGQNYTFPTQS